MSQNHWTVPVSNTVVVLKPGDISREDVDAIVNSANRHLIRGGGVSGAIHRAAGPELEDHCRPLAPCESGQAVITPGFALPARHVIHTVGPRYRMEQGRDAELLFQAYTNALKLATQHQLATVAFPSISTGIYGYPLEEAAPIAATAITDYLVTDPESHGLTEVRVLVRDDVHREQYAQAFTSLLGPPSPA